MQITTLASQESDVHLDYLNVESGLPNNEVTALAQDKYGFIWIGTRGGLSRFDGYQYVEYRKGLRKNNIIGNNSIECILDDDDYLWIGTKSGGLSRFNLVNETFRNYQYDLADETSLSQNRIISIYVDTKGRRWFGTFNNGINLYNKETDSFKRYLEERRVIRIIQDDEGQIWVATDVGLLVYNEAENNFQTIDIAHDALSQISDVALSGDVLIVGTWSGRIIQIDIKTKTIKKEFDKSSIFGSQKKELSVYRVFKDSQGRILIGTWGDGLYILDKKEEKFTKFNLSPSNEPGNISHNVVLHIFENKDGSIWIGTNNGGIVRVAERKAKFESLDLNEASTRLLGNLHVNAIYKDDRGSMWIATKGEGVFIKKEFSSILERVPLPFNNKIWQVANAFLQDENGSMWIGHNSGIYMLNKNNEIEENLIHRSSDTTSLSGSMVTSLFKDSRGDIWVGTQQNGLNKLKSRKNGKYVFERYPVVPEQEGLLNNSRITCFIEEDTGKIWIGTYGGLHLYDPNGDQFVNYKVSQDNTGINSNIITSLSIDKNNNLWIGSPNGFNKLALGKGNVEFQSFTEEDGLPNGYVHAIVPDQSNQLWISTNRGVSNFNPVNSEFRNFDLSDGLSSLSYSESGGFVDAAGMIYFGGSKGVTSFYPDEIRVNTSVPDVYLTSLFINDNLVEVGESINGREVLTQSVNETDNLKLTYRDRVVSFQFTSLSYIASQNNRYKYKLEGYDEDWINGDATRTATYTELPAGDYVFKVMGSNNSNIWNEKPVSMDIAVSQPPWKSGYARFLYAMLIIALLYVIRRVSNAQQLLRQDLVMAKLTNEKEVEMHEMKSRFFTSVSHEIRTPLTLIAGPLEELLNNPNTDTTIRQKLNSVHLNTAHLMRLVSQLLEFRKTSQNQHSLKAAKGNFVLFCEEIYLSFKSYAQSKNVTFEYIKDADYIEVWYDRQKFEIILSNLLLNAFKHSTKGGKVSLSVISNHTDRIYIAVKDDGPGIPPEKQSLIFDRFYQVVNSDTVNITGSGVGLSLVKDLLDLHGGSISLQSDAINGSTFLITLPKGKNHLSEDQIFDDYINSSHPDHYRMDDDISVQEEDSTESFDYTILIVEDNPGIRTFVSSIFKGVYRVIEAADGKIGLDMAVEHIPDLIISDVMMPVMDGLSLCSAVKSDVNTNHIPVILLTARSADFYKIEGLSSGADDYITKPFNVSELKARVKNQILIRRNLKERFQKTVLLEPTEIEITDTDALFLNKAVHFVEEHIDDNMLNADLLAKEMSMSQSTLYRKLKALTGSSISNFIRDIRLKAAAQYLRRSSSSVKEIAYISGFNDVKYFRKCFVSQFEMTPKDFRTKSKEEEEVL